MRLIKIQQIIIKLYTANSIISKIKSYINSKTILNQAFKYSIVGILNTILGLSVIYLLYNFFHFDYILSNLGGYVYWIDKWIYME